MRGRNDLIEEAIRLLARVRDGEHGIEALDRVAGIVSMAKNAAPDGQKLTLEQLRAKHGATRLFEAGRVIEKCREQVERLKRIIAKDASESSRWQKTLDQERSELAQAEESFAEFSRLYRKHTPDAPVFLPLGARVRLKRDQISDPVNGKHLYPLKADTVGVVTMNDPDRDYPVRVTFDRPVELANGEIWPPSQEQPGGHYVDASDLEVLSLAETLGGESYEHLTVAFATHERVWGDGGKYVDRWLVLRDGEGRLWSLMANRYGDGTDVIHQFHNEVPDWMEPMDEAANLGPRP